MSNTPNPPILPIEHACRQAFALEDGYGDPDAMPQRYRIFRDGFYAGTVVTQPTTRAQIAACLRDLSCRMLACGTAMDYYGGLGTMGQHGREMIGAARLAAEWADAIEDEAPQ